MKEFNQHISNVPELLEGTGKKLRRREWEEKDRRIRMPVFLQSIESHGLFYHCQRGSARQCSKSHMHFEGKTFLDPSLLLTKCAPQEDENGQG
jgi:hypothetical protein